MSKKYPKDHNPFIKKCAFCENFNLSKEHIFPDWLKKVIPIDRTVLNHTSKQSYTKLVGGKYIQSLSEKKTSGHIFSKTLRIVCQTCNNGWMSTLQDRTKPILSKLILSEPISLEDSDLIQVSKWVVMATLVAEYDDEKSKVTPSSQLREFKNKIEVPDGWKIWIGNYKGIQYGFRHIGFKNKKYATDVNESYIQSGLWIIGNLFIYVISTSSDDTYKKFRNIYTDKLIQILPLKNEINYTQTAPLVYPLTYTVTDDDIYKLTDVNIFFNTHNATLNDQNTKI